MERWEFLSLEQGNLLRAFCPSRLSMVWYLNECISTCWNLLDRIQNTLVHGLCFYVLNDMIWFSLGWFICIKVGGTQEMTSYQFFWRLCKLRICLRDGTETWNLSCLYLISSRATLRSQKVSIFFLSTNNYWVFKYVNNIMTLSYHSKQSTSIYFFFIKATS